MTRKELALRTLTTLKKTFPDASCTLVSDTPERLAIRGILSAQCTDTRVNHTCGELFSLYPDMESLSRESAERIGEIIKPCGLHNSKARSVKAFAENFCGKWGNEVPRDVEELMTCPGVGKKIANLIVGEIYGIPAIVVDTHCKRVMKRIGLTKETDPLKVEKDLVKVFPKDSWIGLGHMAVMLGRTYCKAQSPRCGECPLADFCRRAL